MCVFYLIHYSNYKNGAAENTDWWLCHISYIVYLCGMKSEQLLRVILPDVLTDNFDMVNFENTDSRFDIWLDEKKVQLKEDKRNSEIIAYGFG